MTRSAARLRARRVVTSSGAVAILQIFAITLYVFPSDAIIKAIGASAYVAGLVGLLAFVVWVSASAIGVHRPQDHRHPMRGPILFFWVVGLVSYALMNREQRPEEQLLSADRWILQLAMITGVVFLAAECLRSLSDVKRVLRAAVAGGAFCGVVAALQYWFGYDFTPTLRSLPGFGVNVSGTTVTSRDAVARVAGTAIHPIELGVVAGMLLPFALYLAMYDKHRGPLVRWVPVACIGFAIPISVSRSAVIALALAVGIFVVLLPPFPRLIAFLAAPVALAGVFMAAPGILGTLETFFAAGRSDPSVASRVDDLPLVEQLVNQHPFFGRGGGTYFAANALEILDNEYFKTAIELGLLGVCALVAFYVTPIVAAAVARRRSEDLEFRTLCGALAGAGTAALVCSATFDALSFPMFTGTAALVAGLSACLWRLSSSATPPRGDT
jgi:hypothetical protein